MYLTEDNRIKNVTAKIPVVGFIDIPNVVEDNTCDINYEIKNLVIKLNPVEEHSIYIELEVGVKACVYEEKQINLIQDLYSPCENLEFEQKRISTMTNKKCKKDLKQIREKIEIDQLGNETLLDVDIMPNIENESKSENKIVYDGNIELNLIMENSNSQINTRTAKIPFQYVVDDMENAENTNTDMEIEVINQDFIIQDGGSIISNIDLMMNQNSYQNTNLNIMNEIQSNGERESEDYSVIMYIVKKGDTLWNIAKEFGSTVEDIVRVNGIEDENKISVGQKIFVPRFVKTGI